MHRFRLHELQWFVAAFAGTEVDFRLGATAALALVRDCREETLYSRHLGQIDHDLHHLDAIPAFCEMLCGICMVQIQPRKHVLDHEGCTAPTW